MSTMWSVRFLAIAGIVAAMGHMYWASDVYNLQEVPDAFQNSAAALIDFSRRHRNHAKGPLGLPIIAELQLLMALNLIGNYVLVVPVFTALRRWLRSSISRNVSSNFRSFLIDVATVSGIIYLTAGGIGAAIITRLYPLHVIRHASAVGSADARAIENLHSTVVDMIHHCFWGGFETIFAAIFFGCVAVLLFSKSHIRSPFLGFIALILLASNAVMFATEISSYAIPTEAYESLLMPALMVHLLISPIWTLIAAFLATKPIPQPVAPASKNN